LGDAFHVVQLGLQFGDGFFEIQQHSVLLVAQSYKEWVISVIPRQNSWGTENLQRTQYHCFIQQLC
ncbi:MAG TPA: hypothetical protein VKZ86_04475, partial [Cyclobacteriaceae bacterium]|nr:hypothetical protein [Cyclobacteriaceae bacterium]